MLHKLYTSTARSLRVVIIISTSVFSAGVNLVSVAVDSEDVPVVSLFVKHRIWNKWDHFDDTTKTMIR